MSSVKTAVSLDEALFEEVESAATEMGIPRSQLFAIALEEFLARRQNQKLLKELDEAYGEDPDPEESRLRGAMRRKQRRILERTG